MLFRKLSKIPLEKLKQLTENFTLIYCTNLTRRLFSRFSQYAPARSVTCYSVFFWVAQRVMVIFLWRTIKSKRPTLRPKSSRKKYIREKNPGTMQFHCILVRQPVLHKSGRRIVISSPNRISSKSARCSNWHSVSLNLFTQSVQYEEHRKGTWISLYVREICQFTAPESWFYLQISSRNCILRGTNMWELLSRYGPNLHIKNYLEKLIWKNCYFKKIWAIRVMEALIFHF